MAFDFQVTIDSRAPHELADWWAEALGWEVEKQDEAFIRRMVESGAASEADTTTHRGALVWKVGTGLTSPDPGRPRVLFQAVPEAKTVKNRVHLDLNVSGGHSVPRPEREQRMKAEVARLVGLGAREVRWMASDEFDESCMVMADPEGNEFCVQ